jgi:hypothetical protein
MTRGSSARARADSVSKFEVHAQKLADERP